MATTRLWLLPFCAALILLPQSARSETLEELYQKAKAEREVVFYSGGPAAPHENRAVDMAFFQTVQDFVTWKKQGKLMLFKPDGFEQVYSNFRDPDGAYMAFS